jgi:hypothetical protein
MPRMDINFGSTGDPRRQCSVRGSKEASGLPPAGAVTLPLESH